MEKLRTNRFPVQDEIYDLDSIIDVIEADIDREMLHTYNVSQIKKHIEEMAINDKKRFYTENIESNEYLRFILKKLSDTEYKVTLVLPVIRNERAGCTGILVDDEYGGRQFMGNGGNSGPGLFSSVTRRSITSILSGSFFK